MVQYFQGEKSLQHYLMLNIVLMFPYLHVKIIVKGTRILVFCRDTLRDTITRANLFLHMRIALAYTECHLSTEILKGPTRMADLK